MTAAPTTDDLWADLVRLTDPGASWRGSDPDPEAVRALARQWHQDLDRICVAILERDYPALLERCREEACDYSDEDMWVAIRARQLVEPKIVLNQARCPQCEQTIVSAHRHDFVSCACGSLSVDGGLEYLRRGYTTGLEWTELSVHESPEQIRERLSTARTSAGDQRP